MQVELTIPQDIDRTTLLPKAITEDVSVDLNELPEQTFDDIYQQISEAFDDELNALKAQTDGSDDTNATDDKIAELVNDNETIGLLNGFKETLDTATLQIEQDFTHLLQQVDSKSQPIDGAGLITSPLNSQPDGSLQAVKQSPKMRFHSAPQPVWTERIVTNQSEQIVSTPSIPSESIVPSESIERAEVQHFSDTTHAITKQTTQSKEAPMALTVTTRLSDGNLPDGNLSNSTQDVFPLQITTALTKPDSIQQHQQSIIHQHNSGNTILYKEGLPSSFMTQPPVMITTNDSFTKAVAELPTIGAVELQVQRNPQGLTIQLSTNADNLALLQPHEAPIQRIAADSLQAATSLCSGLHDTHASGHDSDRSAQAFINFSLTSHDHSDKNDKSRSLLLTYNTESDVQEDKFVLSSTMEPVRLVDFRV